MDYVSPFLDKFNTVWGIIAAVGTYILGQHWWLFLAYLLLNVGDYLTGWLKAAMAGKLSSTRGFKGILKKFGYWIMIALAFGMSAIFIEIGRIIGIDLQVTVIIGWFVLAALIINEVRSILENFVEAGYKVPHILIGGLEVVDRTLETLTDEVIHEDSKEAKSSENEQ